MNRNLNEITDEMLACYLEGKLTAAEKAAVEQYLSEHQEALDAVVLARYELGYKRARGFTFDHRDMGDVTVYRSDGLSVRLVQDADMH